MSTFDIAGIAGLILALIAVYKAVRLTPHEEAGTDADTVTKYEEAASKATDRVLRMEALLRNLEAELDRTKGLLDEQRRVNQKLVEQNAALLDWSERLVHQLRSIDIEPVKIRKSLDIPTKPRDLVPSKKRNKTARGVVHKQFIDQDDQEDTSKENKNE